MPSPAFDIKMLTASDINEANAQQIQDLVNQRLARPRVVTVETLWDILYTGQTQMWLVHSRRRDSPLIAVATACRPLRLGDDSVWVEDLLIKSSIQPRSLTLALIKTIVDWAAKQNARLVYMHSHRMILEVLCRQLGFNQSRSLLYEYVLPSS